MSRLRNSNPDPAQPVLENGLDFISSAVRHLRDDSTERDLKYAVLHLSAGIELILKDRLAREHWSLVFDQIKDASPVNYKSGDFKSVAFKDVLSRITNIAGIEIEDDQLQVINTLRQARNRLEHFGATQSGEALRSLTVKALDFIVDFVDQQFSHERRSRNAEHYMAEIRLGVRKFSKFVAHRQQKISSKLKSIKSPVVWCGSCANYSNVVGNGTRCLFCTKEEAPEDAALQYVLGELVFDPSERPEEAEDFPIVRCPNCYQETLVDSKGENSKYPILCFYCARVWREGALKRCDLCGDLMSSDDELTTCEMCLGTINDNMSQ